MSSFFEKLKKGMGEEISPEEIATEETISEGNSPEKTNSEEIAPAFEDNPTKASFAKISFFKQENNSDEELKKEAVKKEKKPTRQNSLKKNSGGQEKLKKNITEEKMKIETKEEKDLSTEASQAKEEEPEKKLARNAFGIADAGGERAFEPKGELAVDIYQTEKDFVIQSAIAGVKPEDIDILIEDDVITIKGMREKTTKEKADYFSQECFWGPFSKEIILPVEVDSGRAESVMKDGILTIRMPKINKERKRKITVFRDK